MKILVAEDHAMTRTFLAAVLRKNRHEVLEAEYRNKAMRLLKDASPEILITDLAMPALSDSPDLDLQAGFDTLREAKRLFGDRIRIFVMSSTLDEAERVLALRLGAEDAVMKDAGLGGLLQLLARKDIVAIV